MIYFFYGDDFRKVRSKQKAFIKAVQDKKPGISVVKVNEDNWSEHNFENLVSGQGLFSKEILVIFDNLLSSGVLKEEIINRLSDLKKSSNAFVIIETDLDQKIASAIEKFSVKSEKFLLPKKEEKQFNPFNLANALGEKDKRKLWLLYYKAISSGLSAEEIHGILFWQVKTILIADSVGSKDSELKPFVYNKAKSFSKNFFETELKEMSNQLTGLYHQSRIKGLDLGLELEKFILKI